MAATSLARQLQQLSVPGQPSIRQVTSKTRPSFLFEGREAGDIDTEAVYDIGRSGLQELGSIDPTVLSFRETLFSEDCKEYDRSSATVEEERRLDDELGRFLLHLSPYFLLKPAHCCLEWLVRAFRVHSCNVDQVVECVLPYYQTGLFVRMVQLLPIKSHSSPWHWLRPIQKSGKPLSHQTLINHCLSDHAFLVFICELAMKSVRVHRHRPAGSRASVALFTSAVACSLEQTNSVTEELVTTLIPHLTRGLKSKNKDLCAACLSLVGLLCGRTHLASRLVESLLGSIAKHMDLELQREQLMCLSLICTTQEVKELPYKAAKHLFSWSGLVESLDELSHTVCTMGGFVESLLRSAMKEDQSDEVMSASGDVLLGVASHFSLSDGFAEELIRHILGMCIRVLQQGKHGDFPSTQHPFTPALQALSRRYCTPFDKAVSSLLSGDRAPNSDVWSALQCVLSTVLPSLQHQLLPCGTLSLALHHHEGSVRALAVHQLGKMAGQGQLNKEDKEFVSSSVLLRLKDDELSVVGAVLDLPTEVFDMVPPTDLIGCLMGIIKACKWEDCAVRAVTLVSSMSALRHLDCDSVDKTVTELAACLLLKYKTWKRAIRMAACVAESALASTHPLLKGLTSLVCCEEWRKISSDSSRTVEEAELVEANVAYLGWLTDNLAAMEPARKEAVVSLLLQQSIPSPTRDNLSVYVCSNFVLSHFIRVTEDHTLQLKVAAILSWNIHSSSSMLAEQSPSDWEGAQLPQTPLPVLVFLVRKPREKSLRHLQVYLQLWGMNIIINHLAPPPLEASVWLSLVDSGRSEDMFHFAILGVLAVLVLLAGRDGSHQLVGISQQLMNALCQVHFSGRGWLLRFLALVWTAKTDSHFSIGNVLGLGPITLLSSAALQASVLKVGAAYLSALDVESLVAICSQTCPLIPSLLIPLHNPLKVLRNGAIDCLKVIHGAVDGLSRSIYTEALATAPMLHLVVAIVQHSYDITSDPDYLPNVLRKLLMDKGVKGTPSRLRRADRDGTLPALSSIMSVIGQTDTPSRVRAALLKQLHRVHHHIKLSACAALLQDLVSAEREALTSDEGDLLSALLSGYTPRAAALLGACPEAVSVFVDVLKGGRMRENPYQLQAMQLVTPEFYQSLPSPALQGEMLRVLLDAAVDSTQTSFITTARSVMQHLPLGSEVVVEELSKGFSAEEQGGRSQAKRKKRMNLLPGNSERSCKRVQMLLEVASSAPLDLEGEGHLLVPPLFVGLEHCLDKLEGEGQGEGQGWEYTCQLILSLLLQWCNKMAASTDRGGYAVALSEEQFNVELVVRSVRVSTSTQTHHTTFLLLGAAAKLYPSLVLHNVMPIFTFMGDHMLRRDDSYSLHVIQQTVDSIVPVIVQTGRLLAPPKTHSQTPRKSKPAPSQRQTEGTVIELLNVFVDTLPHIPAHRRGLLFAHLLRCLGPTQHLHLMWALLARKHSSTPPQSSKECSLNYLEFAQQLVEGLPVAAILSAVLKLVHYTTSLPLEKPQPATRRQSYLIFDPTSHSTKQLLHFQCTIYHMMGGVLGGAGLAQKLSDLSATGGRLEVENLVLQLLEALLSASTVVGGASPTEELVGRYLGSLHRKVQKVVGKVTGLLSLQSFLDLVGQLIAGSSPLVQHQALGLLAQELQSVRETFGSGHKQQLVHMMGAIRVVATGNACSSTNQIAAIQCIREASKVIAETSTKDFVAISKDLLGILAQQSVPSEVAQACLHSLSEVVSRIGAHLIPLLSGIVPTVLQFADTAVDSATLVATVSALSTVVAVLAKFISPYLQQIALKVCTLDTPSTPPPAGLPEQLKSIRVQLARLVPLRVMLPALPLVYRELEGGGKDGVLCWCDLVHASLEGMLPQDVRAHQPAILELFFTALDYRAEHTDTKPLDQVSAVEDRCVELFGCLVLKMSEATFRPAFLKLFDWATQESGHDQRLITFYHVTTEVASVLKGIFLLFAGHILPKCAELLTRLHSDKGGQEAVFPNEDQCRVLLSYVLQTLHKCFLSDKGQFVTKERFDSLLQPLTDQVTSTLGEEETRETRVREQLMPCIAEFGAASGRDVLWKRLNQRLLLHSRHRNPQIRLTVIKVLKGFYSKLGEEFMVLLPETIPYLAELMEDESEDVERACQQLIANIEGTLGESLQQYLSPS